MPEPPQDQPARDDPLDVRFGEILNDFLDRRARGEAVNEDELLAEHPELADELREALEVVDELCPSSADIENLLARGVLAPCSDASFAAQLGPYKISGLVGRGGMGVVLRAHEESLDRAVALKVLRPDLAQDRSALRRFAQEAKAAAALRHPNIVTVYAVGEDRGTHYIAMELIEGPSLAEVLRERGPLPTEMTREVFKQLLSGLAVAHDAGLIHRDIKPSNILLDRLSLTSTPSVNEGSSPMRAAGASGSPPYQGGAGGGSRSPSFVGGAGEGPHSPPYQGGVGGGSSSTTGPVTPRRQDVGTDTPQPPGVANGTPSPIRTPSLNEGSSPMRAAGASDVASFTVKITDFGLARMLSAQTRMTLPDSVLGTPEYMSPEQARGDDNIDHRTDLYSAGVVLYQMLTGRPPFKADSGSAVIHQILYDDPPDPRTIHKPADLQLSALALRLMAKRPEDRLGSATDAIAALDGRGPVGLPERRRKFRRRLTFGAAVTVVVVAAGWLLTRLERVGGDSPSPSVRGRLISQVRAAPGRDRASIIEARYGDEGAWRDLVSLPEEARRVADPELVKTPDGSLVVAGVSSPVDGKGLFAFSPDGSRAWALDMSDRRQWPDCSPPSKWIAGQVLPVDLDGRAGDELIVVATDLVEYATRVSIVDPIDQRIKATFWHLGGLGPPLFVNDFFGSGRPALVISGLNNKLDGFDDGLREGEKQFAHWEIVPVVLVIDPHDLDGVGPPPSGRLRDLPRANVYAYAYLNMPYAPGLLRVTQPGVGQPPKRERMRLTRDDMGQIDSIRMSSRTADSESRPWFEVDVWSEDDRGQRVGRAILTVDRNLNLVAVTAASLDGEIVGTNIEYWEPFWTPLIQHGEYLAD